MTHIKDFLQKIQTENIQFIDFRFTDLLGAVHHITYRANVIDEDIINNGISFDGSSIRGWKSVDNSDMIIKPDLSTQFIDPFTIHSTLIVICDIIDPLNHSSYNRDPRSVTRNALKYLHDSGIADQALFGPELEFFIFDDVKFETLPHSCGFKINSLEGAYNNNKEFARGNLAHRSGLGKGYAPLSPADSLQDIRAEMAITLDEIGLQSQLHHHEVAQGQCEIGFKYANIIGSADNVQKFKYVIRNVAQSYGKSATFMAKPFYGDNGSGMHTHQSIWKDGANLFFKQGSYADISENCLHYIGGIIKHAKAINAFSNPTTNSYKRLIPGFEAPNILSYSAQNRSAAIRIPHSSDNAKRIEVRFPDPTANPYLTFASLLMAGIDGIKNKIHPGDASDFNLYKDKRAKNLPTLAQSLDEALRSLNDNRQFLKHGNVFSDELIDSFIALKMKDVVALNSRPHPIEYEMYYSS